MAEEIERLRAAFSGRYSVERLLGKGGMAHVYLAQDEKHSRRVAIKVLKPELAATIGAERFLREIRLAAALQHPNILGLYDSGEADGLLYYVMPFIEGESLRDRLNREQQLPIDESLRIAREAAEALGVAHARHIIHRDIKPENILLQGGHALVADFGIAKAVEQSTGKLTETGMTVGTPHYMSPEQSLGGELDGRADEYALGCVLYEMLIGQPPFDGPNAMAVIARHSLEQVPSLQVVRPTVSDDVEDVVHKMLEKTAADRYPDMKHVAEALAEVEAEAAFSRTAARRAATSPRTGRIPIDQRRSTARLPTAPGVMGREGARGGGLGRWLIGAGVLALLGAALFAFMQSRSKAPAPVAITGIDPRRVAVLYFQDQSPDGKALGYLADGLTEDLIRELAGVQGLTVVSQNGVAPFRGGSAPRDSIATALSVGTLVVGSVEPSGSGKVRVTARLVDEAGTEIDRSSFEEATTDPLVMRETLAGKVSEALRKRLGSEVKIREARSRAANTEAWVLMQRAEQARKQAEAAIVAGDTAATTRAFAAADSLAILAGRQDPAWNAPLVLRTRVSYRRSRLAVDNPTAVGALIDQGTALADSALARDAADPDALELRGSLRYWKYLMRLEQGPAAERLLVAAMGDLESATRINPLQAGAWGSLSHLYYRLPDKSITDIMLAARRAYEADAYLENASTILNRLFFAAYDADQEVDAAHWCREGASRFPADSRFVMCQLWLMTMRGQPANADSAWNLAGNDAIRRDEQTGSAEFREHQARMLVGAVLAKAGLKDSGMAVARAARADSRIDGSKSLYDIEAFVHVLAGDRQGAIELLKEYLAANPEEIRDFRKDPGWRFRDLANDASYKAIVGAS